jgi:hypothetical protein
MFEGLLVALMAVVPTSTNYTLETYDFGTGNGAGSSTNYQLKASTGSVAGVSSSTNYTLPGGIRATASAAVPPAPTFTNPDNSYSQLQITLTTTGFPSDTRYLIAISDDDFVTTQYVQADNTVGTNAGIANYQTYAAWGGAGGFSVLDLDQNTTYKVKVAAWRGGGTGSLFGPTATAATVAPSLTFALTTSLTSTPPFSATFASLAPGSVTTASATVTATLTTNAKHGGSLLLKGQNGGLLSALNSYTITSATADLASTGRGYGGRVSASGQSGGGPISVNSPFNGSSDNVGIITNAWQPLAGFTNPITSGNATLQLKAKSDADVPAGADYSDTLTVAASLSF